MTLISPLARRLVVGLALALALAGPASAQDLAERADALMTAFHQAGRFDGSVLVAEGDRVVYERGFGYADPSWAVPNAPDTRHLIASVTKQFTAALVMQLVESGDLALDAPVTRYLPSYPAAQGDRVTVHHLLSHTGGVPGYLGAPGFDARAPTSPGALLDLFSGQPLVFEPGTEHRYSNSGYVLLGAIVEAVTGQGYADALRTRLLLPLGLADTEVMESPVVLDRLAGAYVRRVGSGVRHAPYVDPSAHYSAGAVASTVRDLHRWTRALHAAAPFRDPATFERMRTPVLSGYAYGLEVSTLAVGDREVPLVGHSGGFPGASAWLAYFPESERTVAVLSNTSDNPAAVMRALALLAHGEEVPLPTASPTTVLARTIESDGVEAAVARYRSLPAADVDENLLDRLGRRLLADGEVGGAVRLLELNADLYPDAARLHASLGAAYVAAGDPDRAAASYLRARRLDPSDDDVRGALEALGVAAPEHEPVDVPSDVLDAYLGRYALDPSFVLEVTREGDTLFVQGTGQERGEFAAVTSTRFRALDDDAQGAQISFTRDGDGPASGLTLHQHGRDLPAERVE